MLRRFDACDVVVSDGARGAWGGWATLLARGMKRLRKIERRRELLRDRKNSSHHPMSFSAINVTRDTYFKRGKTAISELSHEGKTTSHTNIIVMLVFIHIPAF